MSNAPLEFILAIMCIRPHLEMNCYIFGQHLILIVALIKKKRSAAQWGQKAETHRSASMAHKYERIREKENPPFLCPRTSSDATEFK